MTPATSTLDSSRPLPTLAAHPRRRRELLAYQSGQRTASALAPPADPFDGEESSLEQDACLVQEPAPPAQAIRPPTLADPALYGLAGLAVRSLAPHTEADPAAILLQFLAAFGNLAGPAPHCIVGSTRHGLNLFVVLVGESSTARKGTSWRQLFSLFTEADSLWAEHRVTTARPTANGIIHALRDQQPATDRRLLLLSEEFASLLHVLGQRNGQLSPLLRCAWDGSDLCGHDGHRPLQATDAHISIVGHVTQSDLARHLSRTESRNGFANRCLWISVRRSKYLPEGGSLPPEEWAAVARELRRALDWVHSQTGLAFRRTAAARELWNHRYPALSQGRADVYGAATSRGEAQVLRLSAIYAALDCSPLVEACHLHAALAVWDYCLASARLFFDASPVDPTVQRIGKALDAAPEGLTRTQIRGLFHRHLSKERIDLALEQLCGLGLINRHTATGRGRPSTLWAAVEDTQAADAGT